MGSRNSSSGWFKQAEQIEQERKSGSIPPPTQRQLRQRPLLPPAPPAEAAPEEVVATPAPQPVAVVNAPATTVEKRQASPPTVRIAKPDVPMLLAPKTPLMTPKASVTLADMPDPAARSVIRSPFHKPPPHRRAEVPLPRPETKPPLPPEAATPLSGRFSLVPDGTGHRLVYARPGDTTVTAPVAVCRLTVPELRQLAASLSRYLGAVDPNGTPGSTPDLSLVSTPPPKGAD